MSRPSRTVGNSASDRPAADLIAILRDKAPRAAMALAAAQVVSPAAEWLQKKARDHTTYTVKVPGNDSIYDDLHEWVLDRIPSGQRRALVAWSTKTTSWRDAIGDREDGPPPALRLRYDGSREHVITVAGHRIKVVVADPVTTTGGGDGRYQPPQITFTARTPDGREALLAEIEGILRAANAARAKPSFRMLDKWGDWERLDHLPPRTLDSVILPPGQVERLTGDVERWLGAEQEHLRRGIPWHRGHLYEGPPGTGKTTVARAIATRFGMDVWYLPLADVKKDGDLLRTVTQVKPRSMLLLEDVDVFHAATVRDDNAEVTLSGLLNTLDGIATPHGLFTVLTTNTPEVLDPAVIRPGRVDLTEHFALAGRRDVARLVGWYYDTECPVPDGGPLVSPGEVIEACKRSPDPAAALAGLLAGSRANSVS